MAGLQEHPEYLEGFLDAADDVPCLPERSLEYKIGHRVFLGIKDRINSPDFLNSWEAKFLPVDPLSHRFNN